MRHFYTFLLFFLTITTSSSIFSNSSPKNHDHYVTIAILAKDKAHTLPLFLECIRRQTWPAAKTYLYIRTNNNNDQTAQILRDWIEQVGNDYAGIYFDDTDVSEQVQSYGQHEWNYQRFKVLGKIRQDSISWAYQNNSDYFVVDCDNFIKPHTLETLMATQLPIVAPFLITGKNLYSNYHADIDENGYFKDCPKYMQIFTRTLKGLIELPVIHCTYFIAHYVLPFMLYDDNSYRYEYVIFSDHARKLDIPQYLDNREIYGYISFAETDEELQAEPWFTEIPTWMQ